MTATSRIKPTAATAGGAEEPARITSADREIELKFLTGEADFKAIQASPMLEPVERRPAAQRLHSVYFDTENGDLARCGILLRIRRIRTGQILTVKWPANAGEGSFGRGEIEAPIRSAVPDPLLLGEDVAAEIARVTEGRPLQACFTTDIKRTVRRAVVGVSELEAAFDTGFIICGEQKLPVREIELELKTGDPADLYRFGLSLARNHDVRLGVLSKAQRGAMLRSGGPVMAVRAVSPGLADDTVDQAIGAIINTCLTQFIANWPVFEGPDRVEAVHQMRVAMRRLRSALALFDRQFPCAEFAAIRAEAKQIASAMGEARNWDVLEAMMQEGPCGAFASEPGFGPLMAAAEARRKIGYDNVAELLGRVDTTRFVLSAAAFVAARGWRNAVSGAELSRLTEPVTGFAVACLARLHHRVKKRGRKLMDLPPEQRHAVRIALKNLRYSAEFLSNLFGPREAVRSYTRATARLQEALGNFNDIIMVTDLIEQLDVHAEASLRAGGIVIGWYGRGALLHDAGLREAWKQFRRVKPFWPAMTGQDKQ
jgi:inorganic triphosphatase YgiF